MTIPQNITKKHLLEAISKIDKEGIPKNGDSQYYDVIYDNKKYPPKLIVSIANIFANGIALDRNSFSGGLDTPCFKLLKENGFIIITKNNNRNMAYFEELKKFLAQSATNEQKTLNYEKWFQGLSVKISFGKGNKAAIPWIAFLKENQTVQHGIYPVYLFFQEKNILILAYGVSETKPPIDSWDIFEAETITAYFKNNNLGRPKRYGNSFVYKVYNTNEPLSENEIDSDLNNIIHVYNNTFLSKKESEMPLESIEIFNPEFFIKSVTNAGLTFSESISIRFTASLITKPFIILTGLSGSGKTKLAQAFALWICENKNQFCIVPIGSDWINREPLLGFPNALKEKDYIKPDNGVLDIIIEANKNKKKPYFLILDEMNLSHVERYFADFLSVMESKDEISLHSGKEDWSGVPAIIKYPENLFIIGTVNIDETTYMFSPKVLDRASVIEFRVTPNEMKSYLNKKPIVSLKNLEGLGATLASNFVQMANDDTLKLDNSDELNNLLITFFTELKKSGAEFGYRTASEILRFAAVANKIRPNWTMVDIIDSAIMQKLLPKVHGSRRKLEPVLKTLGTLCLQDGQKFDDYLKIPETAAVKYPISLEKIIRMYDNLISNGFTSYAEA